MQALEEKNSSDLSDKDRYRLFCEQHPDIAIFSQPWWLDAATEGGDYWDVILIEENGQIIASFPYYVHQGRLVKHIRMPILTQKLGPYIVYGNKAGSESKKIGMEHDIYNKIIERLPPFGEFAISFDQKYKNWLPFYWKGFSQSTYYSYRITDLSDMDAVYHAFSKGKKQPIKYNAERFELRMDLEPELFYEYFEQVVNSRGEEVVYSKDLFFRLLKAVYDHHAGRSFYCVDEEGQIHALCIVVWDTETAYYLIAMRKKEYNTSGGTEFLVYETMKYVSQFVNQFDFEGSMMHGVEQSYRQYGGHQTEYYFLYKCNSRLLRLLRAWQGVTIV